MTDVADIIAIVLIFAAICFACYLVLWWVEWADDVRQALRDIHESVHEKPAQEGTDR